MIHAALRILPKHRDAYWDATSITQRSRDTQALQEASETLEHLSSTPVCAAPRPDPDADAADAADAITDRPFKVTCPECQKAIQPDD